MKGVLFSRKFEKSYKKRISNNARLSRQFDERYNLFMIGVRENPINDHSLAGSLVRKRAFSITGDIRVIYHEADQYYEFLDVGTHSQVYK